MNNDLSYLAELIKMIAKDGDEGSKKRLWSLISVKAGEELKSFSEKDASNFINAVHELNFEQQIMIQAKYFYAGFPFDKTGMSEESQKQMVTDFIEMEHYKRRDDFYRFCIACYQQVENIMNAFFAHENLWKKTELAIRNSLKIITEQEVLPDTDEGWFIGRLFFVKQGSFIENAKVEKFMREGSAKLNFAQKFNILLYFGYFNARVNRSQWAIISDLGNKLYGTRNRVHRGTTDSPRQEESQRFVNQKRYRYYLLFLGFLADFVQKIEAYYQSNSPQVAKVNVDLSVK